TSLGVEEWTFKELRAAATDGVFRLAVDWLKQKDDAWITSLYARLHRTQKSSEPRLAAEAYPIVRLADGSQVRLTSDGVPEAYLPGDTVVTSAFKFVSPKVLADKDAKDFFLSVGYSEPDLVAEVIDHILPLYGSWDESPSESENICHVNMILQAYRTDSIA